MAQTTNPAAGTMPPVPAAPRQLSFDAMDATGRPLVACDDCDGCGYHTIPADGTWHGTRPGRFACFFCDGTGMVRVPRTEAEIRDEIACDLFLELGA